MKRIFIFLLAVMPMVFSGCSKDDENIQTITNLSGVGWYDTQIWFRSTEGGELSGYKEVGTVSVGGTCTVSTDKPIFYIYAKNARGQMIMSKDIHFANDKATVNEKDMY